MIAFLNRRWFLLSCAVALLVCSVVEWQRIVSGGSSNATTVRHFGHYGVSGQDSPTSPKTANRSDNLAPDAKNDPEILAACVRATALMKQVEKANAREIWSKDCGTRKLTAIAIAAPQERDIATISAVVSSTLRMLPEAKRPDAQMRLQKIYNQYAAFPMRYQMLYVTTSPGSIWPGVMMADADDVEAATPSETGKIRVQKRITDYITRYGNGNPSWMERFGHIIGTH